MRRSTESRIADLDLVTCQYALTMISRDVPFSVALRSAEEKQKKERK